MSGRAAFRRDLLKAPNLVSVARVVLIAIAAGLVVAGQPIAALIVGIPAGLSDYLDGYLARRLAQVTEMGALLDVLADVLFALVCFTVSIVFGVWPVYLLLIWGFRDLTVMALRASAAQQGFSIRSSFLGKVASNFNSYAFLLMGLDVARIFSGALAEGVHWLGLFGIHAGLLLQWITAAGYLRGYVRQYRGSSAASGQPG
jgi:cardiolipin synthase (CMP-forming)